MNVCCKSLGYIIQTEYHTCVCTICGKEWANFGTIKPTNQSYTQSLYPFSQCYSRKKRFLEMVTNILFPSFSPLDNTVCELLDKHTPKLTSIPQMFIFLKSLSIKDKRYGSTHIFCKQYMKNYTPPPKVKRIILQHLVFMFSETELVYFRFSGSEQFFNYSWLILTFFQLLSLNDYSVFVKPLKCKKRVLVYENKIKQITHELALLNTNQLWVDALSSFL